MSGTEQQYGMLTVREVARLLSIHANTVRRWSDAGKIKACRITRRGDRRFDHDEIERFLAEMNMTKTNHD